MSAVWGEARADAPSHDTEAVNRIDALLRELELHVLFRLDHHDRAGCARCRLVGWLAGEGEYPDEQQLRTPLVLVRT